MPYIDPVRRDALDHRGDVPRSSGELNYLLTQTCIRYLDIHQAEGYQAYNDIVGALEGCKQEFYRRASVPYEDGKVEANGDLNWYPSAFRKD